VLLAVLAAPPAAAQAAAAGAAEAPPKVIVLGFDGADAELTQQWMDEGQLPNLARLRDQGTFAPLRSTVPSQTPVSWSTFSTGLNPGRHSIFDFLRRDPANYRPSFAAFDEGTAPFLWGERNGLVLGPAVGLVLLALVFVVLKLFRRRTVPALAAAAVAGVLLGAGAGWVAANWLPVQRPTAENRQQGETFWELLGEAGHRVRVVRVPVTFPPEDFAHGRLLSGLGVPDLSFRMGKPFYFTSELFFQPKTGGDFSLEVVELIDNQGEIPTKIKGPPNKLFPEGERYIEIPMTLTVAADRASLAIEVSGSRLVMTPGEWSDWVEIDFPFSPLVKMPGIGRFRLLSVEPDVRLYLSPIQFDPENLPPIFAITAPKGWIDDLTDRHGRFKTMGWAIDTWSITEGTIDEAVFFEDVEATVGKSTEMLLAAVEDAAEWDVLVHYFEFTDRVQHVMYRYFDREHPLWSEEGAAEWGDAIPGVYRRMDAIVGEVMARMPEGTMLMIVSDHGFAPWRRTMNYNTWLAQEGYLVLHRRGPGTRQPRGPVRPGRLLRQRRLEPHPRLCDGARQHLRQPRRPRGRGHRAAGRGVPPADRGDQDEARGLRRRGDGREPGRPRVHPRRGLWRVRPAAHPGPLPVEQPGLPGGVAGQPGDRGAPRGGAEHGRVERRPLLGVPAAGQRHPVLEPGAARGRGSVHGGRAGDVARFVRGRAGGGARRGEFAEVGAAVVASARDGRGRWWGGRRGRLAPGARRTLWVDGGRCACRGAPAARGGGSGAAGTGAPRAPRAPAAPAALGEPEVGPPLRG
jgi:predicted AlkP superfamily phosphohydrolase/phosphomutase